MNVLIIILYITLAICCLSAAVALVMSVIVAAKAIKEAFDDDL